MSKWDTRFLQMAHMASMWSKDRRKVGAVIVRPDLTIASVGFNGFPRGCSDDPKLYADREVKLRRIVHAECNAILNCHNRPEGYAMYIYGPELMPCCARCAAHVIQAGISKVLFLESHLCKDPLWEADITEGLSMFAEAGVIVSPIKDPNA